MVRADEDGRMIFFHNEFLLYFVKCKWNRETRHSMKKISNFVQFNNKNHLLQCKVKHNDEIIKIQNGKYFKLPCNFFNKFGRSKKQNQKPLEAETLNFRVLMDCSNQENLKKLKDATSLNVYKRKILVI